jgi:hypothetical protein
LVKLLLSFSLYYETTIPMPIAEVLHIRSTPHATESRAAERDKRERLIQDTAYILYERRKLMAEDNWHPAAIIATTPAYVLEQRDWDLAKSLVDSEAALAALHEQHAALWESRGGQPVEVYNAPFATPQAKIA